MSILDKPLTVIFPELNSLQIGMIRELMKREYERGRNSMLISYGQCEICGNYVSLDMMTEHKDAFCKKPLTTISEPTTTQYTANVEARSPLENQRGTKRINEVKDDN